MTPAVNLSDVTVSIFDIQDFDGCRETGEKVPWLRLALVRFHRTISISSQHGPRFDDHSAYIRATKEEFCDEKESFIALHGRNRSYDYEFIRSKPGTTVRQFGPEQSGPGY
jgi:hypothetical protein